MAADGGARNPALQLTVQVVHATAIASCELGAPFFAGKSSGLQKS
jgi:hypothetical protein